MNRCRWLMEIHSFCLSEHKTHNLIELLEYAILQRFSKLTLKELVLQVGSSSPTPLSSGTI